jgi:hypothetical protein
MNDTTKADALDGIEPRAWIYEDPNMHQPVSTIYKGVAARIPNEPLYDRAAIEAAIERARADERMKCAKVCEAISDQYREREGLRYPELRSDAETGAGECAAAIEALGTKEGEHHD